MCLDYGKSVKTYIIKDIYIYIYIYIIWSRPAPCNLPQCYPPPAPPSNPPPGVASHLPPSVKISYDHMLYLHAGLVPPMHYITGCLHAVFTTAYMPIKIHLQRITANNKVPL